MADLETNVLYWGDNLPILRNKDYFPDESVDLVYLDPPFNSNASYNVLFREATGERSSAQLQAFEDTWEWNDAAWQDLHATAPKRIQDTLDAFQKILVLAGGRTGRNAMMAYLVMMTARLLELHRVLKPTGSLYLHCDPTASHYLKVILDTIFGPANFRNEIVWRRTHTHADAKRYGQVHDVIFFYAKQSSLTKWQTQFRPHSEEYRGSHYTGRDAEGRRFQLITASAPGHGREHPPMKFGDKLIPPPSGRMWAWTQENIDKLWAEGRFVITKTGMPRYKLYEDEKEGTAIASVWDDIPPVNSQAKERMGYATQKPLALLERIVQASSNEGDVVLDPFCGCGTAVLAAHKLNRRWIGIDITNLAMTVMKARLADAFPGIKYRVIGEPTTLSEAHALAAQEPELEARYQFQWWALGLVGALPASDKRRKGPGPDGFFSIHHDNRGRFTQVIVEVKSGHVGAPDIQKLKGEIGEDKLGVFITLEEPTEPMRVAASTAGLYENPLMGRNYPRIQILTIQELLQDKQPNLPPRVQGPGSPRIGQQVRQGALLDAGPD